MSNFNIGDKVTFIKNTIAIVNDRDFTGKVGTVKKTFGDLPVILVDFDGEVCKIPVFSLEKAPEVKPDFDPKEVVEITREDFHDLAVKFTSLKFLEDLFEGEDIDDGDIVEFASVAAVVVDNLENMIFEREND